MFGLAAAPQSGLILDSLSLRVKLRAPILARALRHLARSAAVVWNISISLDQQKCRQFFVDKEMFRDLNHIFARLKTRELSVVKEPGGRIQTQGENLEFHFSAAVSGLHLLLR